MTDDQLQQLEARPPAPQRPLAGNSAVCWMVLLIVVCLGLAVDLASKQAAFAMIGNEPVVLDRAVILADPQWHPPADAHRTAVPNLLDLHLVLNRGAVFGIGPGQRAFFVVFTLLAVGVGVYAFAFRTRVGDWMAHLAIGCILAGAGGNLFDRIMFGAVRDFLKIFPDVHLPLGWSWPGGNSEIFPWVFNIADVLLLTGIGLLMIRMNARPAPARSHGAEPAPVTGSSRPASPSSEPRNQPIDR